MNALEVLRVANLESHRPDEWATVKEINAVARAAASGPVSKRQLDKLVKDGIADKRMVGKVEQYRAGGQVPPGYSGRSPRDYVPGQDQEPRGDQQDTRGVGFVAPVPVQGIVSGVTRQVL